MRTVLISCGEPEPNNGSRSVTLSSPYSLTTPRGQPVPVLPSMTSVVSSVRYRGYVLVCFTQRDSALRMAVPRGSSIHRMTLRHSLRHWSNRVELQTEFDLITTTDAERLLLRSRSTYYEHGDKASRLLAHQLRRQAGLTIHTSSSCARLTLIQFKVLYRVHFSKARLSQIYPTAFDICDKCQASPCNLSHMFFSCPLVFSFWQKFFEDISKNTLTH
ncbi:hypothetical protein F7725_019109, partial [Dissostichus mawsoni]